MSTLPPELANLPPPNLVQAPYYDARLAELKAKLLQIFASVGFDYDVADLALDPAQILLQVSAYQDTNLRQRINEAIQSWFLAYAAGSDLDALAQFYDVYRLPGETDDALRVRVVWNIKGRSPGGTEARYTAIALGADDRVAFAKVYTVARDPTIRVAIFSTDNSGVADAPLLAKVNAALQNPNARMVNDTVVVESAARQTINLVAKYWLLPDAPQTVEAQMRASITAAWGRDMKLGRDFVASWATSKLQIEDVQKVELINTDVEMPSNQAAALGTITLQPQGRAY